MIEKEIKAGRVTNGKIKAVDQLRVQMKHLEERVERLEKKQAGR